MACDPRLRGEHAPGGPLVRRREVEDVGGELRHGVHAHAVIADRHAASVRLRSRSIANSDTGDRLVPKSGTELELIKGADVLAACMYDHYIAGFLHRSASALRR